MQPGHLALGHPTKPLKSPVELHPFCASVCEMTEDLHSLFKQKIRKSTIIYYLHLPFLRAQQVAFRSLLHPTRSLSHLFRWEANRPIGLAALLGRSCGAYDGEMFFYAGVFDGGRYFLFGKDILPRIQVCHNQKRQRETRVLGGNPGQEGI